MNRSTKNVKGSFSVIDCITYYKIALQIAIHNLKSKIQYSLIHYSNIWISTIIMCQMSLQKKKDVMFFKLVSDAGVNISFSSICLCQE